MPRTVLRRLTLTDFRSYDRATLGLDGRPVFLVGPNGAGKTNLLEAISFLIPGRGLRNAAMAEVGRREPADAQGLAWAVAAELEGADGPVQLGTGLETPGAARRSVDYSAGPAGPFAWITGFWRQSGPAPSPMPSRPKLVGTTTTLPRFNS